MYQHHQHPASYSIQWSLSISRTLRIELGSPTWPRHVHDLQCVALRAILFSTKCKCSN